MAQYYTNIPTLKILNRTVEGRDLDFGLYGKKIITRMAKGTPAGQFQIELMPNVREQIGDYTAAGLMQFWAKTIQKNDVIEIGIKGPGMFLGKVDAVFQTLNSSPTSFGRGLTIVGRNFAAPLVDDNIPYAPGLATNKDAKELLGEPRAMFLGLQRGLNDKGQNIFLNRHFLSTVLWIMTNMPSIHLNVLYADHDKDGNVISSRTGKIGDLFEFDLKAYVNDFVFEEKLNSFYGTVWNYLMGCIDPMFYEIWVDTVRKDGKTKPCLFVRPKPYDRSTDNVIKSQAKPPRKSEKNVSNANWVINPKFPEDFTLTPYYLKKDQKQAAWDITFDPYKQDPIGWVWDISDDNKTYPVTTSEITSEGQGGDTFLLNNDFRTLVTKEYYHTVPEEEEYQFSLGSSLYDVYSYYIMRASKNPLTTTELAQYGHLFPLIDTDAVKRYGMRVLEGQSNLLKINEVKDSQELDIAQKKEGMTTKIISIRDYTYARDRMFNWNRYNPILFNGSAVVKGNDNYRVGDPIYFPHHLHMWGFKGIKYCIDAVTQTWEYSNNKASYESALSLSRGENAEVTNLQRMASGYDLFDDNRKQDGERRNPIIQVGDIYVESPIEPAGNKDVKTEGVESTTHQTDFSGTLSSKSIEHIKKDFEAQKSKYDEKKVTAQQLIDAINRWAAEVNLNANVMAALIDWESVHFNPYAANPNSDAFGLGQFLNSSAKLEGFSPVNYRNPKGGTGIDKADQRSEPLVSVEKIAMHLKRKRTAYKGSSSSVEALRFMINAYGEGGATASDTTYLKNVRTRIKQFFPETKI